MVLPPKRQDSTMFLVFVVRDGTVLFIWMCCSVVDWRGNRRHTLQLHFIKLNLMISRHVSMPESSFLHWLLYHSHIDTDQPHTLSHYTDLQTSMHSSTKNKQCYNLHTSSKSHRTHQMSLIAQNIYTLHLKILDLFMHLLWYWWLCESIFAFGLYDINKVFFL